MLASSAALLSLAGHGVPRRTHPRMRPRLTALTVVVALAGAVGAATALADGDPASDYLISQKVFFPFDPRLSTTQKAELQALVEAANKGGYTIRVAIISSPNDMGTETSLYGKPRAYARFLGAELNYVYNDRLLVVMPGGFGFDDPRHPLAPTYAALRPDHDQTRHHRPPERRRERRARVSPRRTASG